MVLYARGDSAGAQAALAKLCGAYWYPLYAFVRRQGLGEHDAQDLTQEFFARLLQKGWLGDVERERGRFRSFLLAGFMLLGVRMFAKWQKKDPDVMRLKTALINHARMEQGHFVSPVIDPAKHLKPLEIYIAGRYAKVLGTDVWSSQYAVSVLTGSERKRAVEIYARHRDPSAEAMAAARRDRSLPDRLTGTWLVPR